MQKGKKKSRYKQIKRQQKKERCLLYLIGRLSMQMIFCLSSRMKPFPSLFHCVLCILCVCVWRLHNWEWIEQNCISKYRTLVFQPYKSLYIYNIQSVRLTFPFLLAKQTCSCLRNELHRLERFINAQIIYSVLSNIYTHNHVLHILTDVVILYDCKRDSIYIWTFKSIETKTFMNKLRAVSHHYYWVQC